MFRDVKRPQGATENSRPSTIAEPDRLTARSPSQKAGDADLSAHETPSPMSRRLGARAAASYPRSGSDGRMQEAANVFRDNLRAQSGP